MSVSCLNAALPQTQCGECGFAGCLPYAQALHAKQTTIDRCPPGGIDTLHKLAALCAVDPTPYVENFQTRPPRTAIIKESDCIGCTKCIQACPVDAIVGSAQYMHTVITHECTGCGLCITPCPMDCIELTPTAMPLYTPAVAAARFEAKQQRQLQAQQQKEAIYQHKRQLATQTQSIQAERLAKKDYILAALQRKQQKTPS